jgi:uncharacterized protein (TIGR02594 family)
MFARFWQRFWQWLSSLFKTEKPVTKPAEKPVAPVKRKGPYTHQHPIDLARKHLGLKEISGSKHNPQIQEFHEACDNIGGRKDNKLHPDEVPWCSSFINWLAEQCGCEKTNNALASSWDKYVGKTYKRGELIPEGAIVRIAHPGGHVTLNNKPFQWVGTGMFEGLGGNQSNRVCVAEYRKTDIVSIHDWKPKPGTVLAPIGTKPSDSEGEGGSTR